MRAASTTKMITTNTASSLYSRDRKAIAPSCMARPMNWIVSLPLSCLRMLSASSSANTSPIAAAAKAKMKMINLASP